MYDPHSSLKLPPLTGEALEHSQKLTRAIRGEIEAGGPLGFDEFMERALFLPDLGYYSAGRALIGPQGDFVTAPEISPLFGRCLGRQCAEVLATLNGGTILELGAGNGRMARQVMEELDALDRLPERYAILEISPALRKRQQAWLASECPQHFHRFAWLEAAPTRPWQGVLLANEVVDCLPVKRFRIESDAIAELCVKQTARGFDWIPQAVTRSFAEQLRALQAELPAPLPAGYQSEYCTALARWLADSTVALEQGVGLIIDYGYPRHEYYHPERSDGTLMCHYRQRAHGNPLINVGVQDITAFVDFTHLADAVEAEDGLTVLGYTHQGAFLLNLGLHEMLAEPQADDRAQAVLRAGALRLVNPADMGEGFKVLAFGRGYETVPAGFETMDLREKLVPRG